MVNGTHVAYAYSGLLSNLPASGPTLDEWQKSSGQDAHSVQADPMFANPTAGDFRLKPGSPAIGAVEEDANIGACGIARMDTETAPK